TKYLALVYWFPVALLLVAWSDVRFRKFTWKATAQEITLFGGVSLLLLSPWLIKNWVFYGNPLFPFFPTLFPNPSFPPSQVQGLVNDAHARHWGQIIGSPHQWVNVLVFPWQSAMDTSSLGDFVGPVFLALAPLVWSFRPTARSYWSLRVTFIGWWLLWSLSTSMSRLLIPVLAPLSLAIAAALRWGQLPRLLKTLFHLVMFLFVLANGSWIAYYYSLLGGWRSVTGGLSRSEFLSHTQQTYPSPYYSAMEYINQHLPPTGKVLFIGECRSYYCERPFLAASVFNEQPIVTLLKQAGDETDLCRRLKAQGVTHLFLNAAEAVRLGIFNDRFFPVGERETRIWHGFFQRYLQEVFRDTQRDSLGYRALYVYEIVPSPIPGEVFDVPDPLLKVLRLTRAGTG
ncbi:MAG: hypothetical protein HYZ73_00180, partial [Elusimicrobia bacterium]|nr:hypothetical protein [Elusimicrobiota bacterium]